MYELAHPWLLALLPLPMLIYWLVPAFRQATASIRLPFFNQVADAASVTASTGAVVPGRSKTQWCVEIVAWMLIVLALCRPQFVADPIVKMEPQRDLMIALDLSQSMETKDYRSTDGQTIARVEAVRSVVSQFVAKRTGDRLGLIAFGDAPYPLVPFTMDHQTIQAMLASTLPGIAGPRTSLGDAIGLAIKMFQKVTVPEKVLIILTDGNDTASRMSPSKAADIAKDNKIIVHTVGIGNPDATGEDRLDTTTLQDIAKATDGHYFFGGDQTELAQIYQTLDQITPEVQKQFSWRPRIELFYWPLGLGVGLLILFYTFEGIVGMVRRRALS